MNIFQFNFFERQRVIVHSITSDLKVTFGGIWEIFQYLFSKLLEVASIKSLVQAGEHIFLVQN